MAVNGEVVKVAHTCTDGPVSLSEKDMVVGTATLKAVNKKYKIGGGVH